MAISLGELAARLGVHLNGDPEAVIDGVAPLDRAVPGQLSFLSQARFRPHLPATRATAVILSPEHLEACPTAALVTDNPQLAYARACTLLHPQPQASPGVHPTAVVADDAVIHESASIGPQCVIEHGSTIGASVVLGPGCMVGPGCEVGPASRLHARVTLLHGTRIGKRVVIHSGAVLGSDGFGFARDGERWEKIPQLGVVVVGDDVEIGANTTIDRGALGDTVIEEGVKLDNLIQVAHNVRIGAHTAVAGCVGIAGSTRIGRRCAIGGGAGIIGHLEIADGVTITAMTLVTHSIPEPGVYGSGVPHAPAREWNRTVARLRQLDDLARRVRALEDGDE
ncbi:UDP-3-O-(3-hydroxymyristoyl)glucosamine N-acyltransferase [Thioalkalivibrio denitrificans]|uniref:UDP-3-O-acylglucosamine N-acyltransferase n=1 Tax=Thioalkalivibrio denitrificans TaxID=108003 RepID=A0A1V3NQ56_9GAMM|nr:UDP-3-O-(3-hydroxymyristoyl)glucosamine N-acyltransferase [Thioalkalivibrio denitrificans]OOG27171.1 UDP-3-O-(3-hydroxymyristoyl)glucosamine N-acyltransferase [Thioalkalivibrio denitrificans]